MSNNNKRKGKRLEDKIANMLIEHFKVDKKYIQRADSSGNKQTEIGDIDIFHPDVERKFPFTIECKNQEKWKFRNLFGAQRDNKSNPFIAYIEQNKHDVVKSGNKKIGLIVFSKAHEDIYQLIYDSKIISQINKSKFSSYSISHISGIEVFITTFEEILEYDWTTISV